jgi:LysR family transcriptional regulator, glycine cleavage system transcriptional activator
MISDLEMWRCFEAAVAFRTFRRAARELSLTMRMFEYRIKRLEESLGHPLFTRTSGHATLTAEGERLLPQAYRLLDQTSSFGRAREQAPAIELTIGAPVDLGVAWLTQSFERLHAYRPERTLRINFEDRDLIEKVRSGAIDCAIASRELAADGLSCEILHRQDFVFVGSTSLVRKRSFSQRAHASKHVLVDLSEDLPLFQNLLDAIGDTVPWRFARIEYFATIEAVRDRLIEGAGVAVLPRRIVARDLRARRLKQLMRNIQLRQEVLTLLWRSDHAWDIEIRRLAADLARAPLPHAED